MTPVHLAVENNRIKMLESLPDHEADINIQDDIDVILHTYPVDDFNLGPRSCTHCSCIFFPIWK